MVHTPYCPRSFSLDFCHPELEGDKIVVFDLEIGSRVVPLKQEVHCKLLQISFKTNSVTSLRFDDHRFVRFLRLVTGCSESCEGCGFFLMSWLGFTIVTVPAFGTNWGW